MSKARGRINPPDAKLTLGAWIRRNAFWYYPELDSVENPDWVYIAKIIAEDGVVSKQGPNKGQPPTPDAVRFATAAHRPKHSRLQPEPAKPETQPTVTTGSAMDLYLKKIRGEFK